MRRRQVWISLSILLALALVGLDRRPLRLPGAGPRVEASRPWRDEGHGVLLLLNDDPPDEATAEGEPVDPAGEWENLLRQTFGGVDVLPSRGLLDGEDLRLRERSLLVLPRRTLQALPLGVRDRIDDVVRDGGLAVLTEAPDSLWADHLGLRIAAVEWRDPLPWPLEPPGPSLRRPQLPLPPTSLNFRWTVWRYAPDPRSRPRTLSTVRVAGRPAAWLRPVGSGAWSILSLDFGRLAHRLRQGGETPRPGTGPHPAHRDERRQTNDLVLSPDLLRRDEPWLDAWISALLRPALAASPWPRVAAAPFSDDGWFLLGLDGPAGPTEAPVTVHRRAGDESVLPRGESQDLAMLTVWPSETGWREHPDLRETFGIGALRPVGRVLPPGRQKQRLESLLPPSLSVAINRNWESLWSERPDDAFAILAAAGIRVDTSFGPGDAGAGWAFGSAHPFHPLDRRGRPFDLWEVPHLATGDPGDFDPVQLELWLKRNRHGGRGPVLLQLDAPPDDGSDLPALVDRARAQNHRVARLAAMLDWWERRRRTRWTWRWEDPTLFVRVAGAPEEEGERLALLLPRTWHDRVLATWSSDPSTGGSRRVWAFDEALLALEIPAAETTLRVTYARRP